MTVPLPAPVSTSFQFLAVIRGTYPFVIRKIQVDNGTEFSFAFALAVQEAGIRLRYIKRRRPEQNGKVERSHRIDDEEFWRRETFTACDPAALALLDWETRYNHHRFSMALNGLTPGKTRDLRRVLYPSAEHHTPCRPHTSVWG